MLDVLSIKYNNIPMVVFKIIALDLLVIRHCRVNCINATEWPFVGVKEEITTTKT